MKYIHIITTGKSEDCKMNRALALVFNECHLLELTDDVEYPIEFTKEDIKDLVTQGVEDYSVTFDWVGGRPNDRK